jgi:apolipoprotein N-acyltransferase
MLELSRVALATKPDLLLWPEASLPALDRASFERLRALIRESGTPIIFGSDDAQRVPDGGRERYRYFNAAFHFDGHGEFVSVYRKQRLVIFGEYTPGTRWLPFLARWLPAGEGLATGDGPVPFRVEPSGANLAVNICFEDNFGDIVRQQVGPDADFVLNLTNNGWFGESAAQWQHAANAIFRAIENGVPLVRCTNNGLTCWIDELGRLREVFADEQGSVYGSGVAVFQIPLLRSGALRAPTIYHRFGDWFGWSCLVLTLLGTLRVWFTTKRPGSNQPIGKQ